MSTNDNIVRVTAKVDAKGIDAILSPGVTETVEYYLCKTDGGRSESKRPRQSNDCTVRAMALALNLKYDDAYDLIAVAGRKCGDGFTLRSWLVGQPWAKYKSIINAPETLAAFCQARTPGLFFVFTPKHVTMVRDGLAYDSFSVHPLARIEAIWQINPDQFCPNANMVDSIFRKVGL